MAIKKLNLIFKVGMLAALYFPLSGCSLFSGDKKGDDGVEIEDTTGNAENADTPATPENAVKSENTAKPEEAAKTDEPAKPEEATNKAAASEEVASVPAPEAVADKKVETKTEVSAAAEPVEEVKAAQEKPVIKTESTKVETVEVEEKNNSNEISYVIVRGDSLSGIAKKILGSTKKWKELISSNEFIKNPNKIYPGDVIKIKTVTEKAKVFAKNYIEKIEQSKVSETVHKGDTLTKIAKRLLGDSTGWRYIWHVNQGVIHNPNRIQVGVVLNFSKSAYVAIKR